MPSTDRKIKTAGSRILRKNSGCPIHFAGSSRNGWDSIIPTKISSIQRLFVPILASILLALSIPAFAQAPSPNRFTVVLDAAHGGDDTGGTLKDSSGAVTPEKTITLALSVRLRSLLAARGITVVTTRESDATVDDNRRAEIANRPGAQACLSLHATQTGSGIHIFASSLPPAEPSRILPWKTAQAAWVTRSLALAGDLNSALLHAGMTVTLGRTALTSIDSMACPAVAIEIAPEAATGSAQPLGPSDTAYQTRVDQALAAAILEWRSNAARTEALHP
jgi:N-acetylmuramoyl-L-alanine amidase